MPSCWDPIPGTRAGSTRCVFGLHPPWPFPRSEPSRECPHFGVGHGLHVFCADTRGARTCFGRPAAGGTFGSSRVCARSVLPGPRPRPGACARRCGRAHGRPRRPRSPCSSVGRPDLPCKPRGPERVHFRFLSALPLPGDSLLPCDSSARVPAVRVQGRRAWSAGWGRPLPAGHRRPLRSDLRSPGSRFLPAEDGSPPDGRLTVSFLLLTR